MYNNLFTFANDAILIHTPEGVILDVNPMGEKIFGYSKEQLLQMRIKDLHPSDFRNKGESPLQKVLRDGYVKFERVIVTSDKRHLIAEISSSLLEVDNQQIILAVMRDITEQVEARKKLELASRFPEEDPNPVLRFGMDGIVDYCNKMGESVLNELGSGPGKVIPEGWMSTVQDMIQQEKKSIELEYCINKTMYCLFTLVRSDMDMIYMYGMDISARKQSELKLIETTRDLDILLYKSSHDLRGPVASLQGLMNLAKNEIKDENAGIYFELFERSISRMSEIVSNLNLIANVKSWKLDHKKIRVADLVNEAVHSAGVRLNLTTNIHIPEIEGDEGLLAFVLKQLFVNASQFKKPDQAEATVHVSSFSTEKGFFITVTDKGQGIPEEFQSTVFDLFFKGSLETKGSGLGLYIVRIALQKMGGSIRVKSTLNEETTFSIKLPTKVIIPSYKWERANIPAKAKNVNPIPMQEMQPN